MPDTTPTYYRMNVAACSIGEMRRILWPHVSLIAHSVMQKLLGRPVYLGAAIASRSLTFLDLSALPGAVTSEFESLIEDCRPLRLSPQFAWEIPCLDDVSNYSALCLNDDRRIAVELNWVCARMDTVVERLVFCCVSEIRNGRTLLTTSGQRELSFSPNVDVLYRSRCRPSVVAERHVRRISLVQDELLAFCSESLRETLLAAEMREVDFHESRGVFVPMCEEEVEQYRQRIEL